MKRTTLLTTLLVMVALSATVAEAADLEQVGPLLMNHAMENLAGETVSLEDLRGEVLVVNFWASWCAPCLRELPVLDRWHRDWRDVGAQVVAVSIDNKAKNALIFADKAQLELNVWHDGPQGIAAVLDLPAVPTSYIVDRQGRVVLRVVGSSPADLEKMHQTVQALLSAGERKPEA